MQCTVDGKFALHSTIGEDVGLNGPGELRNWHWALHSVYRNVLLEFLGDFFSPCNFLILYHTHTLIMAPFG